MRPSDSTKNWRNHGAIGPVRPAPHPVPEDAPNSDFRRYREDMHDIVRATLRTGRLDLIDMFIPNMGVFTEEQWERLSPATKYAGICIYACVVPELSDMREQAAHWLNLHGLALPDPA